MGLNNEQMLSRSSWFLFCHITFVKGGRFESNLFFNIDASRYSQFAETDHEAFHTFPREIYDSTRGVSAEAVNTPPVAGIYIQTSPGHQAAQSHPRGG